MQQPLTVSQIVEVGLMWTAVISFFSGMIFMARQKRHMDTAKFSDPSNLERFTKNVNCPPVDLLTPDGRLWRKRIYFIWAVGGVAFLILILRKL